MLVDKRKCHSVLVKIEAKMATSIGKDGMDEDKVETGSWHQIAEAIY